ncbi:MerR family transcriptional regulator [Methylobacterium flocculans]|jgi:DNA-binding transcriptional MerR regulator|uniref:MerR family transcriptional regulator n=1 Tax=Methylobacterium flocculans TaxID=2984843 RepID=UPI0021F31905|nr:MerR family transcriptional regulator [Methylobacterium sp. FF17]
MENKTFAIGTLSEKAGVKVPTIRYYEINGLLPAAVRTDTNRRTYDEATVRRLRFIRHARDLGFDVEAIRSMLDLADRGDGPRGEDDVIARRHLAAIDSRLARLSALRIEVQAVADRGPGGRIVEALADADD